MNLQDRKLVCDEMLVKFCKEGRPDAKVELMRRYTPLVKSLSKAKFVRRFREDLEQELWLCFFELIKRYDASKALFSTLAAKALYFRRRESFRAMQTRWGREVQDSEGLLAEAYTREDRYPALEEMERNEFMDALALTAQQRKVIGLFEEGVSSVKVGEILGISQQSAYRIRKRIEQKAKKILKEGV